MKVDIFDTDKKYNTQMVGIVGGMRCNYGREFH